MRRKEKMINEQQELEEIINANNVAALALTDGHNPYVVPISYGYEGGVFYFHSAAEGKKLSLIKKIGRAALSITQRLSVVEAEQACSWGMRFESIYAEGAIGIITGKEEKIKALSILMRQYGSETVDFDERVLEKTTVLKLTAEIISGKRSGY